MDELGVLPDDPRWAHGFALGTDGVRLHYVRHGSGVPALLLHGWPGFWYDWRRVIPRLSDQSDAIAPDFRGFGESDRPEGDPVQLYAPEVLARDMLALLDGLRIDRAVIVAHDIGATVAQVMARTAPERISTLVLFDPPYPGIGARRFEPTVQPEFWYQHFHNLPWSDRLIGHDRETVRLYLQHFYSHWMGRREALHPREFEAIVDIYSRPGAVRSSIMYYRARAGARIVEASRTSAERIAQPTWVLWGEADPVMRSAWSDRLDQYFERVTLRLLPGVGHFVPLEAPDEALDTIGRALRNEED